MKETAVPVWSMKVDRGFLSHAMSSTLYVLLLYLATHSNGHWSVCEGVRGDLVRTTEPTSCFMAASWKPDLLL